jgi:NAD(P)-dependent dehydrogenase (short-subunit alcohol dehydrogenase family)
MSIKNYDRLSGKIAIVTGASGGIGRAIALNFAREGAKVVATTRSNMDALAETQSLAPTGSVDIRQVEATSGPEVGDLVEYTENKFGRVDVLVNNAGVIRLGLIPDTSEEDWDLLMATNLKGTFLGLKYGIPAMRRGGGGSIINLSSIAGVVGQASLAAYSATKGGVAMLTKATAMDHVKENIRINALCPGLIETPMTTPYFDQVGSKDAFLEMVGPWMHPMGIGRPEQVASAALYLASDEASYVTGTTMMVDGGYTAQ